MVIMRRIRVLLMFFIAATMLMSACGPVQYTLSTSVSPSGSGTVTPASGTYDDGTEVELTATPASGYRFDNWSGDATGTASSVSLTMDAEKSVTAHFKAQYTLTTLVSPSGGGTVTPASGTYDEGTEVPLTTTPASGYVFDHWSGDAAGTSSPVSLTMNAEKSVTAHFKTQYALSTSLSPSGGGTISPTSGTYDDGTEVTLTATPASGYAFDHWGGDAVGTSSSVTITMDSDKTITAHFKAQYTLTTLVSPSGGGTITPSSGTYDAGTKLTLTAAPAEGYVFDHWSGDAVGTSNSIILTMDSNKSVTAHFKELFASTDGRIGITLDKVERTSVMPAQFKGAPLAEGHDYVCIYIVFTQMGKAYLDPFEQEEQEITLQDVEYREYKIKEMAWEGVKFWNPLNMAGSAYISEGTKAILVFELLKDQKPVKLTFIYFFRESREGKTVKRGQVDISL